MTAVQRRALVVRALSAVAQAIHRDRTLPHLKSRVIPCADCGRRALQYDHRDYRKPLDVVPVCRSCNCRRGPGAPSAPLPIRRRPSWYVLKLLKNSGSSARHLAFELELSPQIVAAVIRRDAKVRMSAGTRLRVWAAVQQAVSKGETR